MKILILLIFFSINLSSQVIFSKTYGGTSADYGNAIKQTIDGGYIMVGKTESFGRFVSDFYMVKTNQFGDTLWTKIIGSASLYDEAWDIMQLPTGDYLILNGVNQEQGMNLIKTDVSGNVLWNKFYYGSTYWAYGAISSAINGGFILLGRDFSSGNWFTHVLRVDNVGDSLWSKSYGSPDTVCYSIKTTSNGYVVAGTTNEFGLENMFLMKIDTLGNHIWHKTYGGAGYDKAFSVENTSDGGFILVGQSTTTTTSDNNVYLVKTNSLGIQQWSKTFGGAGEDIGHIVKQTPDNGFAIFGTTTSYGNTNTQGDMYLIKTDAVGNEQWHKTYGGTASENSNGMALTSDGGYALFGYTMSYGAGSFDYYLVKTNNLGVTSVDEIISKDINHIVFPNPMTTQAFIYFENKDNKRCKFYLSNIQGEIIRIDENIETNQVLINKNEIQPGIYFYDIIRDNYQEIKGKIIIE